MANILFSLRSTFGLLPSTEKIESKKQSLINEYNKLIEYSNSEELKEFIELENFINSNEFKSIKENISALNFKNSEEYKKEQEYLKIKKNRSIKKYFKILNSSNLSEFNKINNSDKLASLKEIQQAIDSETDAEIIKSKEIEIKKLKKDKQISFWTKYKKSKAYLLYTDIDNSNLLNEYQTLKELIESSQFKEKKEYLLDKKKWEKTDEYKKELKYKELLKSEDIKWYYSVKDSDKFNSLKSWNLTFEENFNSNEIDKNKWMNSYFWGEMLLHDRYVLSGDKHLYTDNKNITLSGNSLKIITKQESTSGKVWNPMYGFSIQDFNYTSGMLTTAHSFRQKYGKFEAKIKLDSNTPVYQAFWLKGEKILPEIDVFKFNMDKKNSLQLSTIWGDANNYKNAQKISEKIGASGLSKGFYIYTLDWTKDKLTWSINDIEIFSTTEGIPDEPLYIILSAGLLKDPKQFTSSEFEIEWIKCYEHSK